MKPWEEVCRELDLLIGNDPNLVSVWRIFWFVFGRTIVMTVWIVAVIAVGQAVDFAWRVLDSFRSRWTLITSAVEVLGLVPILTSAWTIFWRTPEDSSVVAFAIRQIALSLGGVLLMLVGHVFYEREDEKGRKLKLRDWLWISLFYLIAYPLWLVIQFDRLTRKLVPRQPGQSA